jgi:hypothetical protein
VDGFCSSADTSIIIIASLILTALNNRVFLTLHEMGLERYLALLAARLPLLGTGIIAVVALTMLLIHSDWNDVIRLRYILMAHASACVLATLVDLKYFPTVAPQRMAGLVTFSTWITYFFHVHKSTQRFSHARLWSDAMSLQPARS